MHDKKQVQPSKKVSSSPASTQVQSVVSGSLKVTTMTEPTIDQLKARIAKLEKKADWYRRMEQAGKRQKPTKKQKAKQRAAAKAQRRFKARFRVGRGSSPGVPKARIVSGGRVESKR